MAKPKIAQLRRIFPEHTDPRGQLAFVDETVSEIAGQLEVVRMLLEARAQQGHELDSGEITCVLDVIRPAANALLELKVPQLAPRVAR